jgi:hypothetical protein
MTAIQGSGGDPGRAAQLAALRKIIGVLEADPSLGFSGMYLHHNSAEFYLGDSNAPLRLAALEAAFAGIAGPFTASVEPGADSWVSTGSVDGLPLRIRATAHAVAERKVTGVTTTDVVEWVRKPATPESGERA